MHKFLIYFFVLSCLVSCVKHVPDIALQHISISTIESDTADLSCLIDYVNLVPLKLQGDLYVGSIRKVAVSEDKIFILDGVDKELPVKVFSRDGNFLYYIHQGSGPGQLTGANDIQYDSNSDKLIVFDGLALSIFNSDGSFVDKKYINFSASNFYPIKDGFLFYIRPNLADERFLLTDGDLNIIDRFVFTNYNYTLRSYFENRFMSCGNSINICIDTDTIYSYCDGSIAPMYVLDYSPKLTESIRYSSFEDFVAGSRKNDGFYFCGYYVENDNHLF